MAAAPAQQESDPSPDTYLPEDDELAAQAESIRTAIAETGDVEQQNALRSDLVEFYATNGRLDLAGREQGVVAESRNTATDWTLAGDLHFDWMEQQSGTERVKAAQRAAAAYKQALELEPDNLDVRTDLGVAYLNDPASPMLAIQETNTVLEADPDHIQANFNKGVMLLQIGRQAEAIERFEKVRDLTEPGAPAHDRAIEILEQIQQTSG
jgi:tetratricopeptide (TPR) repeat protein